MVFDGVGQPETWLFPRLVRGIVNFILHFLGKHYNLRNYGSADAPFRGYFFSFTTKYNVIRDPLAFSKIHFALFCGECFNQLEEQNY